MTISFARHQFPPAIIRHAVWLYVRFTLSYRDVEDLLAERGLDVSYETVRRWVLKFGLLFARELRRRRPRPTPRWHLDEMAVVIAGRQFWLWRAVDDEGEVLDLLVQRRRDKAAAVKLMRKLFKKQGFAPDVLVSDGLRSYGAARPKSACRLATSRACARTIGPEFASTDATTRAEDAAFQIARISPTILVRSRRRSQHVQRPASSHIPPHASRPTRRSVPDVASRHRGLKFSGPSKPRAAPIQVGVTAPYLLLFAGLNSPGHYDVQFTCRVLRLLCIAFTATGKHRSS